MLFFVRYVKYCLKCVKVGGVMVDMFLKMKSIFFENIKKRYLWGWYGWLMCCIFGVKLEIFVLYFVKKRIIDFILLLMF